MQVLSFRRLSLALTTIGVAGLGMTALAGAQAPQPWQNGMVNYNGDAGMLLMNEKAGFDKAFGLTVSTFTVAGDPLLLKALVAGQIDSYIASPATALIAASKGADVKIVGCGWVKQSYALLGNANVKDVADLKGRTINTAAPGSGPDIFTKAALAVSGVKPDEVTFVGSGNPMDWLKAMEANVYQSAATPDEYVVRAKSMGLKVLTTSDVATPLSMQRCYFFRGDQVKNQSDKIAKFLAAEMAAYRYSTTHRDETLALTRKILKVDDKQPEAATNYDSVVSRNVIDLNLEPPIEKLRFLRDLLAANGSVDAKWDPKSIVEMGPLLKARELVTAEGGKTAAAAPAVLAAIK